MIRIGQLHKRPSPLQWQRKRAQAIIHTTHGPKAPPTKRTPKSKENGSKENGLVINEVHKLGPTKPRHAVQGHQKPAATMNDRLPVSEVHGLVGNSERTRACLHPPATLLIQTKQQPLIQMQLHNLQRTSNASASTMVDNVVVMVVVVVVTDSGIPIVACSVNEDHLSCTVTSTSCKSKT